jgi:hypothetical protein
MRWSTTCWWPTARVDKRAALYTNGRDLKDPMLSPVYSNTSLHIVWVKQYEGWYNMRGFPPAILTTGTRDLLLSSTVRVHRKLREAGVELRDWRDGTSFDSGRIAEHASDCRKRRGSSTPTRGGCSRETGRRRGRAWLLSRAKIKSRFQCPCVRFRMQTSNTAEACAPSPPCAMARRLP